MNAITAGLLHNLRLEDQILTYNEQLANMKHLGMALREPCEDTAQNKAIYELLMSLDQQARESANQIVDDLHDSGINAGSAAGHKGDFIIELITPTGTHLIAGCQL